MRLFKNVIFQNFTSSQEVEKVPFGRWDDDVVGSLQKPRRLQMKSFIWNHWPGFSDMSHSPRRFIPCTGKKNLFHVVHYVVWVWWGEQLTCVRRCQLTISILARFKSKWFICCNISLISIAVWLELEVLIIGMVWLG